MMRINIWLDSCIYVQTRSQTLWWIFVCLYRARRPRLRLCCVKTCTSKIPNKHQFLQHMSLKCFTLHRIISVPWKCGPSHDFWIIHSLSRRSNGQIHCTFHGKYFTVNAVRREKSGGEKKCGIESEWKELGRLNDYFGFGSWCRTVCDLK